MDSTQVQADVQQAETQAQATLVQAQADVQAAQVQVTTFWSKARLTISNHFIPDVLQAYTLLSVWVFAFITALPDVYQTAGAMGLLTVDTIPPKFQWMVRCGGIVGLYLRLVRQRVKQPPAAE